jgi:hypothetical protein
LDGLDLARIELESLVERGAPQTKEIVRQALRYVRFGLGEKTLRPGQA